MYSDALNCILIIYKNFISCTLLGTESKFTIKVNCLLFSNRSPHLQLTDDERHSEDFLIHSAPTFNQCNDSFKNQLTQSLTRNDCELRISKDSSFQSLDEDLRDQNSCWKNDTNSKSPNKNLDEAGTESVLDTCDIDLVERSNESIKGEHKLHSTI